MSIAPAGSLLAWATSPNDLTDVTIKLRRSVETPVNSSSRVGGWEQPLQEAVRPGLPSEASSADRRDFFDRGLSGLERVALKRASPRPQ